MTETFEDLYKKFARPDCLVRRINIAANNIIDDSYEQYSFFVDPAIMEKDRQITESVNALKSKFGKNSILKGMDLLDAATTRERNNQIGGHRAGNPDGTTNL